MPNKYKKHLTISNIITVIVLALVLYNRLPTFLENSKHEGKPFPAGTYQVLSSTGGELTFPTAQERSLVIFWATWCGPCKVEMNRLQTSVQEGKIPAQKIVAINSFEDALTVKKFLKENQYPFLFLDAPGVSQELKINLTPTSLFVENGVIKNMSSGMSFIGIWRAESFLK